MLHCSCQTFEVATMLRKPIRILHLMKKSLSEMQGSLSFSILADHQVARRMKQSVHVAGCINVSLDRQTRPQSPSYVKTKMNSVHFVTGAISGRGGGCIWSEIRRLQPKSERCTLNLVLHDVMHGAHLFFFNALFILTSSGSFFFRHPFQLLV